MEQSIGQGLRTQTRISDRNHPVGGFHPLTHVFFLLACLLCAIPLVLVISISFSSESDLLREGFRLLPRNPSLDAYRMIAEAPERLFSAYRITLFTTATGTLLHLLFTSMMAYSLSRSEFRYRRSISFILFFTMLFNGGLVPYYILMTRYLGLQDSIWALIIPFLFGTYNTFLMRSNFQSLPASLVESAKIDGASEFLIYSRIVLPLSTPTLATVSLFIGLAIWNDWYTSLLFINTPRLYSLQMMLQQMLASLQGIQNDMNSLFSQELIRSRRMPGESLRMAMCLVAIGPIIILFPFLQKYFVQGLTVGSVKG
jgi:putative aldouronate transport system permease protein